MRTSNLERATSNIKRKNFFHFEVRRSIFDFRCLHLILVLVCLAPFANAATTRPTTTAASQPTANDLEVHEWAVFVIDGATGQLNPEGIVTATVPAF